MAIFDLRGTHGSGKTWIVHQLLEKYGHKPLTYEEKLKHRTKERIYGHVIKALELVVLGPYFKNDKPHPSGGADRVPSQDRLQDMLITLHMQFRNVLVEGSMMGHTYTRWARLADEVGRDNYHVIFLNTPLKTCIARVTARRYRSGRKKRDLNLARSVVRDHRCTNHNMAGYFREGGYSVTRIDWKDPVNNLLTVLGRFGCKVQSKE